jgi:hypothetical protein
LPFLKGDLIHNKTHFPKYLTSNVTDKSLLYSLSFREVNYVKVFGEYEYELLADDEGNTSLIKEWGACSISRSYEGHDGNHETDVA